MPKRQLFNTRTQQLEDAELTVDKSNEIIATFADDTFVKFPAGLTRDEFEAAIAKHQEHNQGQEVITPEMEAARQAERAASFALIDDQPNGNTMPESQYNDDTPTISPELPTNPEGTPPVAV